jgi:hypothetical protein
MDIYINNVKIKELVRFIMDKEVDIEMMMLVVGLWLKLTLSFKIIVIMNLV